MILPEFEIIDKTTGERIRASQIIGIDYVDEMITYSSIGRESESRFTSSLKFSNCMIELEQAKFIYTKAIDDIQEDIKDWIMRNKEEIREDILKSTNKIKDQFIKACDTFNLEDEEDKDILVYEVTENITNGMINLVMTYEQ